MFVLILFLDFSPSSQHKALVDSGTAGNFMDRGLAIKLGVPLVPIDSPFPVLSLDSRPLGSGLVREAKASLDMVTQGSGLVSSLSIHLHSQDVVETGGSPGVVRGVFR